MPTQTTYAHARFELAEIARKSKEMQSNRPDVDEGDENACTQSEIADASAH